VFGLLGYRQLWPYTMVAKLVAYKLSTVNNVVNENAASGAEQFSNAMHFYQKELAKDRWVDDCPT
jgi:hypothetical protein